MENVIASYLSARPGPLQLSLAGNDLQTAHSGLL